MASDQSYIFALAVIMLPFLFGACNPFAPAIGDGDPFEDLFGDPKTIEGYFTNFRNAYELRDLSLYEPLIDSSFVFIYTDFDTGIEREWGFGQELESTRRLFESTVEVQLQWNQIITRQEYDEGRRAVAVRGFNLAVALNNGDVFRGDGNVNFLLARADTTRAWRLLRWRDESEL
ncbi:MAG: hypothetical protein F4120_12470 [Rhodothermaceae bacterium]|nr:hypothetical protein [Rhodothermaceae bacterium]MYC05505.1 hypothetical protein [Rhodothermaceae bacterium]MYI18413.1 hypothetical protein [Rhodothermaceae bacterium]